MKRKKSNRTALYTVVAIVVVVMVVGVYFLSLGGGVTNSETTPVSSATLSQLSQVANSRYGTPHIGGWRSYSGSPLVDGNRFVVLFVSGDFCPYCAAERWPLVLALMRFGTFSSLDYTYSGSSIEFPNTPSFSFANYSYSSQYVSLQAYEFEDRNGKPLDSVPANYTAIWKGLPSNGTVPFLDVGNSYVMPGSQFSPSILGGMTQEEVVQSILDNGSVGNTIMAVADGITSVICNLTKGAPASVCGLVHVSALDSLNAGSPRIAAEAWATVQYTQTEWIRRTSAATR